MRKILISLFVLGLIPGWGQQYAGILDGSRVIDNIAHPAGVQGGIPTRTTICQTLGLGGQSPTFNQTTGGNLVTSTTVTNALNTCSTNSPGSVVLLNPGTYNIAVRIPSNVTLRGSGPLQTLIYPTSAVGCAYSSTICMQAASVVSEDQTAATTTNSCTWSAGYTQGTSTITLTSCGSAASSLSTNNTIFLDQADDQTDNGGLVISDVTTLVGGNGGAFGRVIGGLRHTQLQVSKITSITGTCTSSCTVGIDPPLYNTNWSGTRSPGAWFEGVPAVNAGLESLTIENDNASQISGVEMWGCVNCWMTNVRNIKSSARNNIILYHSLHITISNNYFYSSSGGGVGLYNIEPDTSTDVLVENNIADNVGAFIVMDSGIMNMVVGYNFIADNTSCGSATSLCQAYAGHGPGSYQLWEGNYAQSVTSDNQHGAEPLVTFYRNWLSGNQPAPNNRTQQTFPIFPMNFARIWNVVANVLGTPGYHTTYETYPGAPCSATTIYYMGRYNAFCGSSTFDDNGVRNTIMRWGNYDVTAGGETIFDTAQASPAAVTYINANPIPTVGNAGVGQAAFPASFYYSAKPSWWSSKVGTTPPWPPIGPDVTGGQGPGGHAYENLAYLCYLNTPADQVISGTKAFDANNCYGASAGSPAIGFNPTTLAFGNVVQATTSPGMTVTITNTGTATEASMALSVTGTNAADFAISSTTCGASLGAGSSCTATLTVTPAAVGSRSASLHVAGTVSADLPLTANGTASGPLLTISPPSLSFTSQQVGTPSAGQSFTVTNTGTSTANTISISSSGDFVLTLGTCSGVSTLAVNVSCSGTIQFSPTALGTRTGTLTVTSTAPTATTALSGTGIDNSILSRTPCVVTLSTLGTSCTIPATPSSGATVVAGLLTATLNWTPTITVTMPGATCSLILSTPVGLTRVDFYQCQHPTAGDTAVTFTPDTGGNVQILLWTLAGNVSVDQTGALTNQTASTTLLAPSLTTVASAKEVILAEGATFGNVTGMVSGNLCSLASNQAGNGWADTVVFATGAYQCQWAQSSGQYSSLAVSFSAAAAAPIVTLQNATVAFGKSALHRKSSVTTLTLKNTGSAALSISSIAPSGDYTESDTCGASVAAGSTCIISITALPTAAGSRAGSVVITSNAPSNPDTVSLTATGVYFQSGAAGFPVGNPVH